MKKIKNIFKKLLGKFIYFLNGLPRLLSGLSGLTDSQKRDIEQQFKASENFIWRSMENEIPVCNECKGFTPYIHTNSNQDCYTCHRYYQDRILRYAPDPAHATILINKITKHYEDLKRLEENDGCYSLKDYEDV